MQKFNQMSSHSVQLSVHVKLGGVFLGGLFGGHLGFSSFHLCHGLRCSIAQYNGISKVQVVILELKQ